MPQSPDSSGQRRFMVIAILAVAAIIAVIAIITGLVKGFSRTKTWATEYVFAAAISILIFTLADTSGITNEWALLALKVGVPAALTIVFAIFSNRFKAAAVRGIKRAEKRSYYLQYGNIEQNKLEILDSIELGDRRAYNRLSRRRFKMRRGGAGVADRFFGAVTLLIKTAVVFSAIAIVALVVVDLTGLGEGLSSLYDSNLWVFISSIAMDLFVVAVIFFAIRAGYRTGISGALWTIIIIVLICGTAYITFTNLEAYEDMAVKLADGANISFITTTVAECIIAFLIFVVALVVIIIVGCAVGGIISRARESKAFSTIDGIYGAVVALAIALAILLVLGGLLWSMSGSAAFKTFNSYMFYTTTDGKHSASIASAFYNFNPINSLGWFENLPFYMPLSY